MARRARTVITYGVDTQVFDLDRCDANPQSTFFGLIKYRGTHEIDILKAEIATWGNPSWKNWQFKSSCLKCGLVIHDFGLSLDALARKGLLDIMDKKGIDYHWQGINDF